MSRGATSHNGSLSRGKPALRRAEEKINVKIKRYAATRRICAALVKTDERGDKPRPGHGGFSAGFMVL